MLRRRRHRLRPAGAGAEAARLDVDHLGHDYVFVYGRHDNRGRQAGRFASQHRFQPFETGRQHPQAVGLDRQGR